MLAYPVLHDPIPPASPELTAGVAALPAVLRFPPETSAFLNRNFLGDHRPTTPYAFAGLGEVSGLPRTLVVVCELDDLQPSGLAFAASLETAGVPVAVELVRGVAHGHLNVSGLPETLDDHRGHRPVPRWWLTHLLAERPGSPQDAGPARTAMV